MEKEIEKLKRLYERLDDNLIRFKYGDVAIRTVTDTIQEVVKQEKLVNQKQVIISEIPK